MFKTEESALHFLRNCNNIIIPSMFTYWCHSSRYSLTGTSAKKVWSELPSDVIEVKGELSLLTRRQRFEYALERHSLKEAPTSYTILDGENLRGFQLKVVMPKMRLTDEEKASFNKDDSYFNKLNYAYRGLGDGRHPKLPGKTKIYIFGYMKNDEMSGTPIDTVFGVREEDLIYYANAVSREILQPHSKLGSVPASIIKLPEDYEDLTQYENKREMLNYGCNCKVSSIIKNNNHTLQEDMVR